MSGVKRIYVEKRPEFNIPAHTLYLDLKESLALENLESVRIINRYDIEGVTDNEYAEARGTVFSEPTVDDVYDEDILIDPLDRVFAIEFLPGQYDQTADSAAQCIQILTQKDRPNIVTAKVIILKGIISDQDFDRIKKYCINAVECREARLDKPSTLNLRSETPEDVAVLKGFINKSANELELFMQQNGMAMNFEDLVFCQKYFREVERRDPTITELKVIDTYWSDHCRHTTFLTKIDKVDFSDGYFIKPVTHAFNEYLEARHYVYGDKDRDISLMDIATISMKEMKKRGMLQDLDESEEINACSIVVNVDIDGESQEWLVMFKNETHNHPTEIEPFGGAATCLGGAIRDPLSGRSYVYQAMRVTGSADPRVSVEATLPGKLPQKKITTGAAAGYSSYGNQIGLATGQVAEIYHEDFVAKRMEIGAVIAAAPKTNVVRVTPQEGDVVILVGGATGRDGCGGATGSSKEHTEESLYNCGAEVQKGNAPTERKIQRLFRNPKVSRMIKRCNDFGAGGVSVAIGELTEGLVINLDAIPKKYEGLDGTELAISESQERMAVVVSARDIEEFIKYADIENLDATVVAKVTEEKRLKMMWRGKPIVDISREFLDTNGVKQQINVQVDSPSAEDNYFKNQFVDEIQSADIKELWLKNLQDLNICSQKGLVENFDSTIGAGTILMPFGGRYQSTPSEGMAAKLPVLDGETTTATAMTYGYNPVLSKWSPFHGAVYAVVEAAAKITALGGDYSTIRLTLQEYFEKLGQNAVKWGKPFSALLGALFAQQQLGIPAIGGKDSMSGTFKDINVPPTLVAFAVNIVNANVVISPEFKAVGSKVVLVPLARDEYELPNFEALRSNFAAVTNIIKQGKVLAAHSIRNGGIAAAISKMTFGNKIGMNFNDNISANQLFAADYGSLILEIREDVDLDEVFGDVPYRPLGTTSEQFTIEINNLVINLEQAQKAWEQPLERIFPTMTESSKEEPKFIPNIIGEKKKSAVSFARPRVFIPVFPGTNCEYDSARAFEKAGGLADTLVIRNLTPNAVEQSIGEIVRGIENSQIVMLPGGFSAGDEPDGSGKFIATMFRNPRIKEAIMKLLNQRDGLMLGICNGFQALIKLGLVPYGEIVELTSHSPTLTHNKIGRHVSCMVQTKIVSNKSPWLYNVNVGDIHTIAVSHGEGRFVANEDMIAQLSKNGQIVTQYVDFNGHPSSNLPFNPNGSVAAIEGITSPDGRVLGKMGHSERVGNQIGINVPGVKDQQIFASGIKYFK
ncbi:phosphoribosylformylglycinamidine synthase [Dendrosporobacter sp. 1207_IL3150]|uniref:phosphoribosylformylglycinamidine synthase n=1 Tax=Dendrosporobacter sp. 1207_IL3150 TaxID=3084054 RepID=UPI002FDB69AA